MQTLYLTLLRKNLKAYFKEDGPRTQKMKKMNKIQYEIFGKKNHEVQLDVKDTRT